MAEKYFYSATASLYWVTVGSPSADMMANYPADTVEVPQRPLDNPEASWDGSAWVAVTPVVTVDQVDAERDRRMAEGVSFDLDGTTYLCQSDAESRNRIGFMATLARFAVAAGAAPDDYRWHGEASDFEWITADNQIVKLDAFEMVALGDAFMRHITVLVFNARAIKDMSPIPSDFKNNSYWS